MGTWYRESFGAGTALLGRSGDGWVVRDDYEARHHRFWIIALLDWITC